MSKFSVMFVRKGADGPTLFIAISGGGAVVTNTTNEAREDKWSELVLNLASHV